MIEINSTELINLLGTYGYLAVLLLVAVESAGVPVPGEAMLIVASAYAGTTHHLHILLVVAAAAAGAVVGDNLGYLAGRVGGQRLLRRFGRFVGLDSARLSVGQYLFDRHGGKVVFFGRFIGFLRVWAAFLAGAHRMPWTRFLAFNAAGGAIWASLVGMLAYTVGSKVLVYGGPVGIVTAALATGVMLCVSLAIRRKERGLRSQIEQRHLPLQVAGC